MSLEQSLIETLRVRPEIAGIACIDVNSGLVVSAAVRDDAVHEGLASAAACAPELCSTPESAADESYIVGSSWMHVLVRASSRPELLVVGVAPAEANLALLMTCARELARRLPSIAG